MLLATPRHVRVPVREALESLAFDQREPSNRKSVCTTREKCLLLRCRESRTHVTLHQSTLPTAFLPRSDNASTWNIDKTR